MGRAARANPRSFEGQKAAGDVALERLKEACRHVKTPRQFEQILETVHPQFRKHLAAQLRPFVTCDPEAIREYDDRLAAARSVLARMGGL